MSRWRLKAYPKESSSTGWIFNIDLSPVGLDEPFDDTQAKACAVAGAAIAAPESFEYVLAVRLGDALAMIAHRKLRTGTGNDLDGTAATRVRQGIVDEVSNDPKDRLVMAEGYRIARLFEAQLTILFKSFGCERRDNRSRGIGKVYRVRLIDHEGIGLGQVEHLAYQPGHIEIVAREFFAIAALRQAIDTKLHDCERGPQFMRRVRGKGAQDGDGTLQSPKRPIDGADQRVNLAGGYRFIESGCHIVGIETVDLLLGLAQWVEDTTNGKNVEREHKQGEGNERQHSMLQNLIPDDRNIRAQAVPLELGLCGSFFSGVR